MRDLWNSPLGTEQRGCSFVGAMSPAEVASEVARPFAAASASGSAAMPAADRKLRIALAVFEPAGSLGPAIGRLLDDGVPLANLGLIALRTTANCIASCEGSPSKKNRSLSRLLECLSPLSRGRGYDVMASTALLRPWYLGLKAPGLWIGDYSIDPGPRLAADLEQHVLRGAAILTAVSATTGQHWKCTRILLEQSCAPVLALECSLPPLP